MHPSPNQNPFPVELRTMAFVPRWSIVWTLNKDTISNHTFFVVVYALHIARLIKWKGPMDGLAYHALMHDLDETITGDIVSPVKSEILDVARADDYISRVLHDRFTFISEFLKDHDDRWCDEIDAIIQVADRLDALFFLLVEKRMGNGVVEQRIPKSRDRLLASWSELPLDPAKRDMLWATVVLPAIKDHEQNGGWGV